MTSPHDERPPLDGADEEFVDRMATAYAPAPMTAAERAAFDGALRARLERRPRRPVLVPALAAVAAAAVAWLALSPRIGPGPPGQEESEAVVAGAWEYELFLSNDLSASDERDEGEVLPEDYLAIASAFLGG